MARTCPPAYRPLSNNCKVIVNLDSEIARNYRCEGMHTGELSLMLFSFLVTLSMLPFFWKLALRASMTSRTGLRRVSVDSVPVMGGIALALSVPMGCLIFGIPIPGLFWFSIPVLLLGAFDDTLELTASLKLPIEILMASLFVFSLPPESLVFSSFSLPMPLVQAFTVFWMVGFVNSINISDGIDGLAGAICLVGFAAVGFLGTPAIAGLSFILVGGLLAFLPFNFSKRYKVFLGDNGSLFLGFMLSGILATSRWGGATALDPLIALVLISYPQVDTVLSIARRLKNKKRIMDGDRRHIHHLLVDCGFAHWEATGIIVSLQVIAGISLILAAKGVPVWIHSGLTLVMGFSALLVVLAALTRRKKREASWISLIIQDSFPHDFFQIPISAEDTHSYLVSVDVKELNDAFGWLPPHRLFDIVTKLKAIGTAPLENNSIVYSLGDRFLVLADEREVPSLKARFKRILESREFKLDDSQFEVYPASEIHNVRSLPGIAAPRSKVS